MSKERVREGIKSALIVLLLMLLVYLTAATWLYDAKNLPSGVRSAVSGISEFLGLDMGEPEVRVEGSRAETYGRAVFPVSAAVSWDGGRVAAYGRASGGAERLFERLAPLLGEAAGSAERFTSVSEISWQTALGRTGVFFRLCGSEPFSLFALGLGVTAQESTAGLEIESLMLLPEDGGVVIYIKNEDGVMSAKTSASSDTLLGVITEYEAGGMSTNGWREGALFSFERGLEGEMLAVDGTNEMYCLDVSVPAIGETTFETLLSAFGINPMTNYRYTTPDGSRRALEGGRSLELNSHGGLIYRDSRSESWSGLEIDCTCEASAIEQVRRIAELTVGSATGDARIALRSFEWTESGAVVRFGYVWQGMPVYIGDAEASAVFEIEDGVLVRAELLMRRFSVSAATVTLIPERRAQFLAGGETVIAYHVDVDEQTARPEWVAPGGETK